MKKNLVCALCLIWLGAWGQDHSRSADEMIGRIDSLDNLGLYSEALQELSLLKKRWPQTPFCEYGVRQGNLFNRTFKYDSALNSYRLVIRLCNDDEESVYSAMHGAA